MEILIAILGAGIGSGGMAIVLAIIQRRWKKKDEKEVKGEVDFAALKASIDELKQSVANLTVAEKISTKERIHYLGLCYIAAGEISLEDKETIVAMHDAYEGLGGNGDLDTIMEEVEKLKVVDNYAKLLRPHKAKEGTQ